MRDRVRAALSTAVTVLLAGIVVWGVAADAPSDAERLEDLSARIACPVCDGSSIGASPSTYARDMQDLVAEQIAAGATDDEILRFFSDRYGPGIILDASGAWVLWAAPAVLAAAGVWLAAGRRRPSETP